MSSVHDRINRPLDELASKRRTSRQGRRNDPVQGRPQRRSGGKRGADREQHGLAKEHLAGATLRDVIDADPENVILKVSSGSNAKSLAGAIGHTVREADACPTLLAGGMSCVNTVSALSLDAAERDVPLDAAERLTCCVVQAVKAIAIARDYLSDDGVDLIAAPEFDGDSERATIKLKKANPVTLSDDAVQLTVKNHSDPYKVAGAIAGKIRDGERVSLLAVGPTAVFRAIESIAVSREYLQEDQVDVKFCPTFTTVEDEESGRTSTGMYFGILTRGV